MGSNEEEHAALSTAQRARIERNRLRARALHDARLALGRTSGEGEARTAADPGGGFLPETAAAPAFKPRALPAPLVHPADQPRCLECDRLFPQSYLFDSFDHRVCDGCRDDEDKHALLTRTEVKYEYLLKDCDLDSRPPPLRCVRRRNPHSSRYGDMRLYLRAQVEARALQVWGSEEQLQKERDKREESRSKLKQTRTQKRLRALRMDVRSSLYDRSHATHAHAFGPEAHDAASDTYSRQCTTCGYEETYEKM